MKIIFSDELVLDLKRLKKKDRRLFDLTVRKVDFFSLNPRHPSLRLHKLSGTMRESWSISINRSIRMVFYYVDEKTARFVDMGKHEEVYRV